jgi:dienelactone hydrolase
MEMPFLMTRSVLPVPYDPLLAQFAWALTCFQTPFDIGAWAAKHNETSIRSKLDAVVTALKEQGVTAFGTTGYCLGAKYCLVLATENVSKVTVLSHPSLLSIPGDFEVRH